MRSSNIPLVSIGTAPVWRVYAGMQRVLHLRMKECERSDGSGRDSKHHQQACANADPGLQLEVLEDSGRFWKHGLKHVHAQN